LANQLGLFIEQNNKLIISPQIYQAFEIMQLTLPELINYINNELVENPLIEVEETVDNNESDFETVADKEVPEFTAEEKWLDGIVGEVISQEKDNWVVGNNQYDNDKLQIEGQWLDNNTLEEYLMEQLRFIQFGSKLSPQEYATAQYLIGNLDSNGYLAAGLEETAEILQISQEEVLRALTIIQLLDPPGIGARNLKECLKLQFHLIPECPPKMEQILDYLDDLAAGHYKKIAHAMDVSVQEVKNMRELLKLLDPKPGSRFDNSVQTKYIVPDAAIKKIGNEYYILVNESDVPKICINEGYKKVLRQQDDQTIKKYLREKINSGLNLIKCIENRRTTIHDVLEEVVKRQKDFLDCGVAALKPLTMKEVAEVLGLHESTISRVSSNKYIETPRGLFPIKCFFAGSLGREKDFTSGRIKDDLKKYISGEDPTKPYSDQELADIFAKNGIEIARRTIAKYREELRIASSSLRKKSDLE